MIINNIKGQSIVNRNISNTVNGSLDSNSLIEKSIASVIRNPIIR